MQGKIEGRELTPAQLKIMACLGDGLHPNELPARLGIAPSTVHTQLSRICDRLGAGGWREALSIWKRPGQDPTSEDRLNSAEVLLRQVLLDPAVNSTHAQPKLLRCLELLDGARRILRGTGG